VNDEHRQRFDRLFDDVVAELPPLIAALVQDVPIVILDRPTTDMVDRLRREGLLGSDEDGSDLCGLHSGVGLTERSIEDPASWGADLGVPEHVHLFREGIVALAFESLGKDAHWEAPGVDEEIYEEIRITLLHELGHHVGLDEDDLHDLGYS